MKCERLQREAPSSRVQLKEVADSLEVASHRCGENVLGMERGLPMNAPLNGDRRDEVENCLIDHDPVQTAMHQVTNQDGFQDDDPWPTIAHPLHPTRLRQIVLRKDDLTCSFVC